MTRDEVMEKLKANHGKIASFNVKAIALFGSLARGEATPTSDIDMMVDFSGPATFDQYMGLKILLEDLFKVKIDLVTRKGIRSRIFPYIEKDLVYVKGL